MAKKKPVKGGSGGTNVNTRRMLDELDRQNTPTPSPKPQAKRQVRKSARRAKRNPGGWPS